jgi:hypothetical protein
MALLARIPQMDRFPADCLALFIEEIQTLAHQEAGSLCFHPLHPPRMGFLWWRKQLMRSPNLAG